MRRIFRSAAFPKASALFPPCSITFLNDLTSLKANYTLEKRLSLNRAAHHFPVSICPSILTIHHLRKTPSHHAAATNNCLSLVPSTQCWTVWQNTLFVFHEPATCPGCTLCLALWKLGQAPSHCSQKLNRQLGTNGSDHRILLSLFWVVQVSLGKFSAF